MVCKKMNKNEDVKYELINKILPYGKKYYDEYLMKDHKDVKEYHKKLTNDWKCSLNFLFAHIFYQGRYDSVSDKVQKAAMNTIDDNNINPWDNLCLIFNNLNKNIGKGKIGKKGDITMTKEVLIFLKDKPQHNIVNYSIDKIKSYNICNLYNKLRRIYQIGDKIATFYLRDLISLFELQEYIKEDELEYLIPIDTWVRQISKKVEICHEEFNNRNHDQEIQSEIARLLNYNAEKIINFDAGAWYIGKNGLVKILM